MYVYVGICKYMHVSARISMALAENTLSTKCMYMYVLVRTCTYQNEVRLISKTHPKEAPSIACLQNLVEKRCTLQNQEDGRVYNDHHQQTQLQLYAIVFFSIDYTRLCTIISDYTRLFYFKKSNDYTRLFHYLTKDDYFTYFTTIISLIFFGTHYCDYCDYRRLCALFLSQTIIRIFYLR